MYYIPLDGCEPIEIGNEDYYFFPSRVHGFICIEGIAKNFPLKDIEGELERIEIWNMERPKVTMTPPKLELLMLGANHGLILLEVRVHVLAHGVNCRSLFLKGSSESPFGTAPSVVQFLGYKANRQNRDQKANSNNT